MDVFIMWYTYLNDLKFTNFLLVCFLFLSNVLFGIFLYGILKKLPAGWVLLFLRFACPVWGSVLFLPVFFYIVPLDLR